MPTFEQLVSAAYKAERQAGRRLARDTGLAPAQALRLTLETRAGAQGLAHLLAARDAARQADAARKAASAQRSATALALRKNRHAPGPEQWFAWFDGSAHPNPGKIGIGGLLSGPGGEHVEISRGAGHGNSSEAEYLALIAVLEAAVRLQPAQLVIHGDSRVVIDDVQGPAANSAHSLRSQRARALQLIAQLASVELRWLPRQRNGAADRLSQQAVAAWQPDEAVPNS